MCECVCVCVSTCVSSIGYSIVKIRHLIERESTTKKRMSVIHISSNNNSVLTYMCVVSNVLRSYLIAGNFGGSKFWDFTFRRI